VGPGFKTGACCGSWFENWGVMGDGLKTRGVVGPKNSADEDTYSTGLRVSSPD